MRGAAPTPKLRWAGLLLALVASACIHDWDSLEAPEGEGGSGGTGTGTATGTSTGTATGATTCPSDDTSVSGICEVYCDQVNSCVVEDPSCVTDCEAAVSSCPSGARESIRSCLNAIDTCSCAGVCGVGSAFDTGFLICMATTVSCWDPPHECP